MAEAQAAGVAEGVAVEAAVAVVEAEAADRPAAVAEERLQLALMHHANSLERHEAMERRKAAHPHAHRRHLSRVGQDLYPPRTSSAHLFSPPFISHEARRSIRHAPNRDALRYPRVGSRASHTALSI